MPAIKGKPVLVRRKRVTLVCTICAKSYEMHLHRATTSKYCSKACWSTRAHKTCKECGVEFGTVGHYGGAYCSRACSVKGMVGESAPAWKDGKSLERNRARQSGAIARWRVAVRKRDGQQCMACGETDHLHVHHVKPFAEFPELATVVDNGLTLCELCHSVVHGRWVGAKARVRRWQEFTGKSATLESDGRTFAEVSSGSNPSKP